MSERSDDNIYRWMNLKLRKIVSLIRKRSISKVTFEDIAFYQRYNQRAIFLIAM